MSPSTNSLYTFRKEFLIIIEPDVLLMQAQEVARRNGVHHLPVVRSGELLGIVCTCDMLINVGDSAVGNIMREPIALPLSASIEEAASLMARRAVGSVLLLEGVLPVGIVTRGDIFQKAAHVANAVSLSRCECCGQSSHLRVAPDGHCYCVSCRGHLVESKSAPKTFTKTRTA